MGRKYLCFDSKVNYKVFEKLFSGEKRIKEEKYLSFHFVPKQFLAADQFRLKQYRQVYFSLMKLWKCVLFFFKDTEEILWRN